MNPRGDIWQEIRANTDVSVLIIGGGVNGIGLFRELALQDVDCLLVDEADFVAGASSKSSRMIHGGLRYLENAEFKLVREALLERNRLLDNAAHYVSPLKTTLPLFSWLAGLIKSPLVFMGLPVKPGGRGVLIAKVGLWFYDFVTRKNRRTPTHFLMSRSKALKEIPGLNPDIVATATYWDAWITQAERLCIEMIHDARNACPSCRALNYVGIAGAEGNTVTLREQTTGKTVSVKPRIVVNATGAWVDRANAELGLDTKLMGPTKGSHLVVDCPELYKSLGDRMVYYEHKDGRICIVFRFLDKVIMGSTDIRIDDPDAATCDEVEIEYMMSTLRGMFPGLTLRREHIVAKYCGVRPLPMADSNTTGRVSRDHSIEGYEPDSGRAFPILCLVGGKWTTFRALAEQTADQVLSRLGLSRRVCSEHLAIGGGKDYPKDEADRARWIERVASDTGLSTDRIATLLSRYGTAAEELARRATPEFETPLTTLPGYSVGEIEHIVATECVEHLPDLIWRRSLIGLLGQASPDAVAELADIAARTLDWDDARKDNEIAAARDDVSV